MPEVRSAGFDQAELPGGFSLTQMCVFVSVGGIWAQVTIAPPAPSTAACGRPASMPGFTVLGGWLDHAPPAGRDAKWIPSLFMSLQAATASPAALFAAAA